MDLACSYIVFYICNTKVEWYCAVCCARVSIIMIMYMSIFRYASRCMMFELQNPPLRIAILDYMDWVQRWNAYSSCAGFCISLGSAFFSQGIKAVDQEILHELSASSADSISPRVLPFYTILYWFAHQV